MANDDIWPMIATERRAHADDLAKLSDDEWATPSLCGEWSVKDVVAHMTATAETTPGNFLPRLMGAGFSLKKMSEKDIAKRSGRPSDVLARFKNNVASRKHPPGPVQSGLGEAIVHSEDVRRPLGIAHTYDPDALAKVADFYRGSNLVIGGKKRVAGLTLKATDADWQAGSGPEVSGPLASLVMAIAGRRPAFDDLDGPGKATLVSRD
jgi:uncharacterized protein (TIGR03083 family)